MTNRTTILAVLTGTSLIASAFAAYAVSLSSEIGLKNKAIDFRNQEIERYMATIATQRTEIEEKSAELDDLKTEISARSLEVEDLGSELSAQRGELIELQQQAARLQSEIELLKSKIRSDELYVASLSRQLELSLENAKRVKVSHYGLAVINEEGMVFPIEVEVINSGSGTISVDLSNAQYETTFQSAVRTAVAVASEYTGESISDKDIVVRIINDQPEGALARVDGSSAGALIAGMMIAALTDKGVNDEVMITGTINPNGSVGRVSGIEDKTDAALEFGANLMLVPKSQEFDHPRIAVIGVIDIDDVVRYLVVSK